MPAADAASVETMAGPAAAGAPRRLVLALLGLYGAAALAALPFAARPGPEVTAITPLFVATVLITEVATGFLVLVRFEATRRWSLLLLGAACLFAGLMAVLHLLTFPGAILPGRSMLGMPQAAAWTFLLWMGGYAGLALAAVAAAAFAPGWRVAPAQVRRHGLWAVALVAGLVLGCGLLVTGRVAALPPLMLGQAWTPLNAGMTYGEMVAVAAAILLSLAGAGRRDPIFLWLGLALSALLVANLLSLAGGARYSLGWSLGRLSWAVSASVLFLFFMGQFLRQQQALARAKATLEERVAARTAELTQALGQRDLLLREVYHRVENNLQIVDSLIHAEARPVTDPAALEGFARLRQRVFTLGQAHQQLMRSADLRYFDIAPFLEELVAEIRRAALPGCTVEVLADPVAVDLDFAIPLGLIVTELVAQAVRQEGVGRVAVAFRREAGDAARLTVSDDGPAAPGDLAAGNRLIAGLTRQLGGRIGITREGGTRIGIDLPIPEAA
ncbi:histidine kinase dimerization/phosphoacceptor domain -containing protein [Paeniroseomonas aquatica]|uniref:histidine kinase n=1 Tax=Paeniroseomonas aquatica TaxID=373043 RepID=A0ABT8ADM0_9PROT|nr:histidine kinase dimerization/phosphoacceptor domain -containing protein [Paeniroseomonas aquatica]MDN3567770.1 histidine kinase dimerization/phosphoacceptor domain -containing protein [Paeniroseomonas aquatica]